MAKGQSKPRAKSPSDLAANIEQQEHEKHLAKARAKGMQKLNTNEKAAVRRDEQSTFLGVFLSCPKTLFTDLLGAYPKVIQDQRTNRGFPWPEGKREAVDGRAVLRFLWEYFLKHKPSSRARLNASVDDILLEGASQELRDQYVREQILEKQLQRELKELELAKESEAHLPTEKCQEILADAARLIAKKREYLERVITGEDREKIARAFEDLADDIQSRALAIADGRSDEEFEKLLAG